jgi:hypothetical protein
LPDAYEDFTLKANPEDVLEQKNAVQDEIDAEKAKAIRGTAVKIEAELRLRRELSGIKNRAFSYPIPA